MQSKSNMKSEGLKREKEHNVLVCPYWAASNLEDTLAKYDAIINDNQNDRSVYDQKEVHIKHVVLMEAFFKPLDWFLQRNQDVITKFVEDRIQGMDEKDIDKVYAITVHASRIYLYLLSRFSLQQIDKRETDSPEMLEFITKFENCLKQIPEDYDLSAWWEVAYKFLLESYMKEDFNVYGNPEIFSEIFWRYLKMMHQSDIENQRLWEKQLDDINDFYEWLDMFLPWNTWGSIFLKSLWSYGFSFQILFAMVWSTAENLLQQEEFASLTDDEKKQIFFSIKTDLLVEAKYWSKQFLNDNQNLTESMSMVMFMKDTSTIPWDKFVFDFDNLQTHLNWETYLKEPIKPEIKPIRRWCPVLFVSGNDKAGVPLWWNLLARQIDYALELYFELYLSKK